MLHGDHAAGDMCALDRELDFHCNVFFEFAFTVQVKHIIHKLLVICLSFTTGHFHTCT